MTVQTRPWADSTLSSDWPWLRNVSTSAALAKGEDYQELLLHLNAAQIWKWCSLNLSYALNKLTSKLTLFFKPQQTIGLRIGSREIYIN